MVAASACRVASEQALSREALEELLRIETMTAPAPVARRSRRHRLTVAAGTSATARS
jgi:hypothetical protein